MKLIYQIESTGFVAERDTLGKEIATLARAEKEPIAFYTYADSMLGGSTVVFLACSESFAEKIRALPLCARVIPVASDVKLVHSPSIDHYFKTGKPPMPKYKKPDPI